MKAVSTFHEAIGLGEVIGFPPATGVVGQRLRKRPGGRRPAAPAAPMVSRWDHLRASGAVYIETIGMGEMIETSHIPVRGQGGSHISMLVW
jgi:hypothetical protein